MELELEPLDKDAPDSKNWHAILDTYGHTSDQRDTFSQAGYVAARVIVDLMLKMDPSKIDRASVSQALKTMKGFRSDIMCGPWYFGEGDEHNANHAGSVAVVRRFVARQVQFVHREFVFSKNGRTDKKSCVRTRTRKSALASLATLSLEGG